jgi:translation initiation factor eIF-2B subunit delta
LIIVSLFSHIPIVHRLSSAELLEGTKCGVDRSIIHPALLEFALQAAQDLSLGEERFTFAINSLIRRTMTFLYSSNCHMTPVGIANAIRFLKAQNSQSEDLPDEERSTRLINALHHFIEDKIDEVVEFIERTVSETIVEGDIILTYGCPPTICNAFLKAHEWGVRFRVIIVDSRPNFDAKRLIEKISELDVRYVLITGLSYVMPEAKKVLIEPCSILSNNTAQTPIRTAVISTVAHESGVPVMFACPS